MNELTEENYQKLQDVKELRALLKQIPQKTKENILNGILLFEAGYNNGYLDYPSEKEREFV